MTDTVQVPREATEEMILAGHREIDWCRNDQNTQRPYHPSQQPGSSCGDDIRDAWRAMIDAAPQATDPRDVALCWTKGEPPKYIAEHWFIAETTYGDRLVLRALPEEYTYDYKTADDTYIKADKIKRWMQFPDSEFKSPAETAIATLTAERDAAREGNEAVNEKYDTLLKVLSDVYAERDAALEALLPFAIMGKLIDRYFPARLDTETFHSGGAWTDNGVKRTLTLGDFRRARASALTTHPSKTETRG